MATLRLLHGDCLHRLRDLPDASVEAVICDPPYGIDMARWDRDLPTTWLGEAHRVLVPGGRLAAFSASRTFHRLALAVEEAGFVGVRLEGWAYSSGAPKHRRDLLPREIDDEVELGDSARERTLRVTGWIASRLRELDLPRSVLDAEAGTVGMAGHWCSLRSQPEIPSARHWPTVRAIVGDPPPDVEAVIEAHHRHQEIRRVRRARWAGPASPEARTWTGWGTSLKPSWEPVVLALKARELSRP